MKEIYELIDNYVRLSYVARRLNAKLNRLPEFLYSGSVDCDYRELGLRIKQIRQSQNLTQDNLAEMVSCNTSHISNIENNHTKVSLNVLLAIANALNTSIDYLLSNQYENTSLALDNEILRALKDCDNTKKEKILKMIEIL